MTSGTGETGDALSAVRAALAAGDHELAAADAQLADVLRTAQREALESVARIDAVRSAIDSAVADRDIDGAAAARDFGAFLVQRNRQISAIITESQAIATAKAIALQQLSEQYRSTAQR